MFYASTQNATIKELVKLKEKKKIRDEEGMFLVEGNHLVQEAKQANLLIQVFDQSNCSIPVLEKLSATKSGSSVIGLVNKPKPRNKTKRILALDNVQDPGNVGTLLRSALAFGIQTVYLGQGCADPFGHKAIQASQGALFHLNIFQGDLDKLIEKNECLIAAVLHQKSEKLKTFHFPASFTLLLGNEGQGIQDKLLARANHFIEIESQFESLNVAVAGSILLYQASL